MFGKTAKGIDGNKKIKGAKLNLVTTFDGFILDTSLTPTNIHDSFGGLNVASKVVKNHKSIKEIIADKGYRGTFYNYFLSEFDINVKIDKNKYFEFTISDCPLGC